VLVFQSSLAFADWQGDQPWPDRPSRLALSTGLNAFQSVVASQCQRLCRNRLVRAELSVCLVKQMKHLLKLHVIGHCCGATAKQSDHFNGTGSSAFRGCHSTGERKCVSLHLSDPARSTKLSLPRVTFWVCRLVASMMTLMMRWLREDSWFICVDDTCRCVWPCNVLTA